MVGFFNRLRRLIRAGPGLRFALAWHAVGALLGFILSALLILLDPFDLDRGIAERGRDAFYEIAAFAYPEGRSPKTMVVLLDDQYLNQHQLNWPVPYAIHAQAIESIAARQPSAIVVDFLFIDRRTDEAEKFFYETLSNVSDNVKIYLAAPPRSVLGVHARPEIEKLVADSRGKIQFVSVSAGRDLGAGSTYPLVSEDEGLRPAAVALHEDIFCRGANLCNVDSSGGEMDIWWAVPRTNDFNCRGNRKEICSRLPRSAGARLFSMATGVFSAMLPSSWRPLNPVPLPYAPTIGLSDLLDPEKAEHLAQPLQGAVVFYGANLAFAVDAEMTPTQGRLPSVHAHAMAFDNLHALEGHYIRARPPFGFDGKAHLVLLIFILAFTGLAIRIAFTLRRPRRLIQPHRREKFFGAVDGITFVIGAIAIAVFEFSVLHIGPYAWAPVLAAVAAGDFLSSRHLTGRAFGLLRWVRKKVRRPRAQPAAAPAGNGPAVAEIDIGSNGEV